MEHYEMILKCINGIYSGKFFYLNSLVKDIQEDAIIGCASYESSKVTASMQDAGLEPTHIKILFKNDYFMSDLNTSQGT